MTLRTQTDASVQSDWIAEAIGQLLAEARVSVDGSDERARTPCFVSGRRTSAEEVLGWTA